MIVNDGAGGQACRYPTYRETLLGGTSELVIDQVEIPAPTIWAVTVRPDIFS